MHAFHRLEHTHAAQHTMVKTVFNTTQMKGHTQLDMLIYLTLTLDTVFKEFIVVLRALGKTRLCVIYYASMSRVSLG